MIINLVDVSRWARLSWSTVEWRLRYLAIWARSRTSFFHVSLGLWPLYSWLLDCKLLVKQLSYLYRHRGVPSFIGVMLRTPGLRYFTILCVTFPLILCIKLNGTLHLMLESSKGTCDVLINYFYWKILLNFGACVFSSYGGFPILNILLFCIYKKYFIWVLLSLIYLLFKK